VVGPSEAFALFGVEADQLELYIFSDAARSQLHHQETLTTQKTDEFGSYQADAVWAEYPTLPVAYGRLVLSTLTQTTPSIGILVAGPLHSFPNPTWGFEEEWADNSIVKKLRVGAKYTKNKARAKRYSGGLEFFHASGGKERFEALKRFRGHLGADPFALKVIEGLKDSGGNSLDQKYLVWASFSSFKAVMGKRSHSTVNLSIEEYL